MEQYRKKIDEIDIKIVRLLDKRFSLVNKIAKYKKKNKIKVEDKNREKEILFRISKKIKKKAIKNYIIKIYKTIFRLSKDSQKI